MIPRWKRTARIEDSKMEAQFAFTLRYLMETASKLRKRKIYFFPKKRLNHIHDKNTEKIHDRNKN